jgi:hypothetical protein
MIPSYQDFKMQRPPFATTRIRTTLIIAAIFFLLASLSANPTFAAANRITGTYSNLAFNSEGGDLIGVELRIAATRKGYQGVLQFAEGVPEDLILVDLQVKGQQIQFVIPESSRYAGSFSGVVRNGVLTGHFKYKNNGAEDIVLKKGKSYWD